MSVAVRPKRHGAVFCFVIAAQMDQAYLKSRLHSSFGSTRGNKRHECAVAVSDLVESAGDFLRRRVFDFHKPLQNLLAFSVVFSKSFDFHAFMV
jgi:hypothetical protein